MMQFRAIIPLKFGADCKTRLAPLLPPEQRENLVLAMAHHVIDTLRACPAIGEIAILSPARPPINDIEWLADEGTGLNAELARSLTPTPTLILHADLPLLGADDISAICDAAEKGAAATPSASAIAPDHIGTGTNAIALVNPATFTPRFWPRFWPRFGPDSFALHRSALPDAAIIRRAGLGFDLDTPDDLAALLAKPSTNIARPIWQAICPG